MRGRSATIEAGLNSRTQGFRNPQRWLRRQKSEEMIEPFSWKAVIGSRF